MILFIDNYDSFTWNLVQRLGELDDTLQPGRDLVVVRNDKITPDQAEQLDGGSGPSHVIVSPGPCTPREAGVSGDIIERFAGRVPVLGVCLGHQCMGHGAGMTVERHAIIRHGKTSDISHDGVGLFEGIPSPMTVTRYHSLIVRADSVPPTPAAGEDGWVISARCTDTVPASTPSGAPTCVEAVMGLRRVWADPTGKAPLEGVQFHPESFLTTHGPRLLANFLAMGDRGRPVSAGSLARAMEIARVG